MMLSDVCLSDLFFVVCLSVAYIGPKSRTERLRKTKIGTEVAHVTHDSDTSFKVKRSKVKVTRPLCSPPCWRIRRLQRWAWGNCCYVAVCSAAQSASAPTGEERGGGISWRPPACGLFKLNHISFCFFWSKPSSLLYKRKSHSKNRSWIL